MCSRFYLVPLSNGTGLPKGRELADLYQSQLDPFLAGSNSLKGYTKQAKTNRKSFELAITTSWFLIGEVVKVVKALEDVGPSIHKDWSRGTKVFDGGSIGLKGGIEVVEVVVKWNDGGRGGICEGIEVIGGKRPSCTL
ncbi:hypothetical protein Tco_0789021 [Tanacetum coccineum]